MPQEHEESHPRVTEKGLEQIFPSQPWHFNLGLLVSGTVRQQVSVKSPSLGHKLLAALAKSGRGREGSNDSSLKNGRLFSKKERPQYTSSWLMLLKRQDIRTSEVLKCHLKSIKKKSKTYKGDGYTKRALG